MTHVFDNFPIPGETVKNERRRVAADAGAPVLHAYEELGHPVVRAPFRPTLGMRGRETSANPTGWPPAGSAAGAMIVREPVREYFGFCGLFAPMTENKPVFRSAKDSMYSP